MGRTLLQASVIFLLMANYILFAQDKPSGSQIIHLFMNQYLMISETKVSLWENLGDWSKKDVRPIGQFRKKTNDKLVVEGLTIYRYESERQVITAYDKSLNPIESTPISGLNIEGNISVFGVSAWGDYWVISGNGEAKVIPTNGSRSLKLEVNFEETPETFVAFKETMALITNKSVTVYDLFGNALITFPRPEIADQFVAYTKDTMLFWDANKESLTALGTRPNIHLTFTAPCKPITPLSDPSTNTVSFWPPCNGSSVLTPRHF